MRAFGTEISGNRGRNDELSPEVRAAIIYGLEAGQSPSKLAARFRVHRSTIYRTKERFILHKTIKTLPRSGRPRKISQLGRRYLYLEARRNPRMTYRTLGATTPHQPSRSTI
jgi:transposase